MKFARGNPVLYQKTYVKGELFAAMRKVFDMEDLDCANCAAKMEAAIAKIDGVTYVNVSFIARRMTLEADDAVFDAVLKAARKAVKKIEPDCRILDLSRA